MAEPVKFRTSLPGMPDVRIWLHPRWIVVQFGTLVSQRAYKPLDADDEASFAAAFVEATS